MGSATSATAPARQDGKRMLWWVAGLAMVGLLLIVAYPVLQNEGPTGAAPASSAPAVDASSVDLSSMTPREAADRLFDRVMRADAAGDSAEAFSFLPMAVAAYERAEPLDADGSFHLAVLKQTAMDFEGALAVAEAGLQGNPDHLLNLVAAARAQHALGDLEGARERYARVLEVWDEEEASGLPDYVAHSAQLPQLKAEAESFLEP